MAKKGLLERLAEGPVIGDGSMCMTLEKRGYCRAGPWTPEAVVLYPEAVRQLLREYLRAGSDVLQTPCFYASDGKLECTKATSFKASEINDAACKIARQVAEEGDAMICGGLSPVPSYVQGKEKAVVRQEFENQLDVFIDHDVDFVLAEFFGHVEEIEICIDVMKRAKKPIGANMRIGPLGDLNGVSVEECAVRMAKAGADMIGVNCLYDLDTVLKTLKRMKDALKKEGLSPYLMCQPLGWRCPEVDNEPNGYLSLPDFPLSLDSRTCTRAEVHKFTRAAYELGVRYIGGCCGMEPHHIRAMAQELTPERKKIPPVNEMCPPHGGFLHLNAFTNVTKKNSKEYWYARKPCSGRPFSSACSETEDCDMITS